MLARWLLLPAARQPQAHSGGLGADFAHGLAGRTVLLAALVPLAVLAADGGRGLLAGVLAGVLVWGAWRLARARLGGLTGDVLGLTVELAELGVLLGGALAV